MRDLLTTVLELVGASLLTVGVWLTAGLGWALIVGGGLLVGLSWALSGAPLPRRSR